MMNKLRTVFLLAVVLACTSLAVADSSGNFSATGTSAACAICNSNASTPNPACANTLGNGNFVGGTTLTSFEADISTSNGNGVTLDIRPDLETGLFTDTKISTTVPSATAEVGIQVCVTVDGSGTNVLPASCVIYDERFQQLSSQLFSQLTECTNVPTGATCSLNNPACTPGTCGISNSGFCTATPATACTSDAQCSAIVAGDTCNFSGICVTQNNLCNIQLILSTLAAHSFDFIVSMPGVGKHKVVATWSVVDNTPTSGNSNVLSCVGPGVLTVTQEKVFENSGSLSFSAL